MNIRLVDIIVYQRCQDDFLTVQRADFKVNLGIRVKPSVKTGDVCTVICDVDKRGSVAEEHHWPSILLHYCIAAFKVIDVRKRENNHPFHSLVTLPRLEGVVLISFKAD